MHLILCYRDLYFPKLCWHIRLRPMSPPQSFQHTRENHIDTVFHTKRVNFSVCFKRKLKAQNQFTHVLLTSNEIYEHIRDGICFSKHHVPKHYQNTWAGELQAKMSKHLLRMIRKCVLARVWFVGFINVLRTCKLT